MNDVMSPATIRATDEQRSATSPGNSAWVAASAGSGKTKVLTDRVLRLLLNGTAPQQILCLTFTKAAAAEMAVRIAETLEKWTSQPEKELHENLQQLIGAGTSEETRRRARQLFARVLDAPGGLKILTIHAFCQSVLKRFPLEAGLAPHFEVLDERSAAELFMDAREEVLNRARGDGEPVLSKALQQVTRHVNEFDFVTLIQELARKRGRLQELIGSPEMLALTIRRLHRRLGVGATESVESLHAAACRDSAFDVVSLRRAAAALGQGSGSDIERSQVMTAWLAGDEQSRIVGIEQYSFAYLTQSDRALRSRMATNRVIENLPPIVGILTTEANRLLAVFA